MPYPSNPRLDQAVKQFGKQTFPKGGFHTWMDNCLRYREVEEQDMRVIRMLYEGDIIFGVPTRIP